MKCVIIETPYAGDTKKNLKYLRACMRDCFKRGEAPFASHGLYTQGGVLDDDDPKARALGIAAGLAIGKRMDATVVYKGLGITEGMKLGIQSAELHERPVEYRWLPTDSQETHHKCFCESEGCAMFVRNRSVAFPFECRHIDRCHKRYEKPHWCKGPFIKKPE